MEKEETKAETTKNVLDRKRYGFEFTLVCKVAAVFLVDFTYNISGVYLLLGLIFTVGRD